MLPDTTATAANSAATMQSAVPMLNQGCAGGSVKPAIPWLTRRMPAPQSNAPTSRQIVAANLERAWPSARNALPMPEQDGTDREDRDRVEGQQDRCRGDGDDAEADQDIDQAQSGVATPQVEQSLVLLLGDGPLGEKLIEIQGDPHASTLPYRDRSGERPGNWRG